MLQDLEHAKPPLVTPLVADFCRNLRVELQHALTRPLARRSLTTAEYEALLEDLFGEPDISPTPPASPGCHGLWIHIFDDVCYFHPAHCVLRC